MLNLEIGQRLRNIRESRDFTRKDVEELTRGEFKESILAMYEGGQRRIAAPRLKALAEFYTVPVAFLLGETVSADPDGEPHDLEAILLSDPTYSQEERDLLLHVMNMIKAKRKAEGK